MTSWYDEPILYERDVYLLAKKFKMHTVVIELEEESTSYLVSLHAGSLKCSCDQKDCTHIQTAKVLIAGACQLVESNPFAPTQDRLIPLIVLRLAAIANVNPIAVYNLLGDKPITKREAMEVLTALSYLTGEKYSLETVDVPLLE